jgi:endonuclease G
MAEHDVPSGTIEDAYQEALARFSYLPEVTGIDIGPKYTDGVNTGKPSIRIHVRRKHASKSLNADDRLPSTIGGYPVDVLERNYVPTVEGTTMPGTNRRVDTVMPGVSVSHELCPTGTLGLIVRDNASGKPALLTNWHILADSRHARAGDPILQPSATDGGSRSTDTIATLTRTFLDHDGDAGIAILNNSRPIDTRIRDLGKTPKSVADPKLNDIVVKSGRSTRVTRGRVEGMGTYFPFYTTRDRVRIEGFKIVPLRDGNPDDEELSSGGDSGSVWLLDGTDTLVGLHFAGETDPDPKKEEALACFATRVLKRLKISLPS